MEAAMGITNLVRRLMRRRQLCPDCGGACTQAYCDVCGYDLVRRSRSRTTPPMPG
jgi:predicted amidophosphoribosyltransferase